jgi:hypothetical protein
VKDSGQIGILERHQSELEKRRETLRSRILGAIRSEADRGMAVGWIREIEELSQRIGSANAHLSRLADEGDKARQAERQEAHAAEQRELTAPERAA